MATPSLLIRVLVLATVAMTTVARGDTPLLLRVAARQSSLADVMRALAKRRSGTARFREERHFRHLTAPIILTGTLSYTAPGQLIKSVETPRKERLVIKGNTLLIYAADKGPPRTALLSDIPALAGMAIAMRAVLSGDIETLHRHFTVSMAGQRQNWSIGLLPKSGPVRERIARIVVNGAGGSPARFEIHQPDGDRIVTYITER